MFKVRDFIAQQKWIFAKTYADKCPHEYIVRGKCAGTDEDFISMVQAIQMYGQVMWFWKRPSKYLYVDGRYYWALTDNMKIDGDNVELDYNDPTIVINRSNAKDYFISIRWKGLPK